MTVRSGDVVSGVSDLPKHEVIRLLMVAARTTRSDVLLGFDVDASTVAEFGLLVERRRGGEPLQYIEGTVHFGSIEVRVDPRVLIPRPETEYMFELVVPMADHPEVIVDLCTGSGNLAIALAVEFPLADVYATDLSADAAAVAEDNVRSTGIGVDVRIGDLFAPLPDRLRGRVDLIVANPPYLAERELADVPPDVRAEPTMALVAGREGDEVLARIAGSAGEWLAPGGLIMCEISEFHGPRIAELFGSFGATVLRDLTDRDRYVVGRSGVG